jgi:hypothetical protein
MITYVAYIYDSSSMNSSYNQKYFNVVEKIQTYILRSITFSENRAVCEMMWENMVKPERPQMTI